MILSLLPIIYIFIALVVAHITFGFFKIHKVDITLITLSLIILIVTILITPRFKNSTTEHFISENELKPIVLEEDITPIKNSLVVYNTSFNKLSYDEKSNQWINIASSNNDKSCEKKNSNMAFSFELPPVYSRKTGFYLGNNRIVGPYSNALGIQYHNTFTMIVACKHGNLLVEDNNREIELFKLYANSPNNNGLTMYIQKNSLKNINNVQMGNLMFQYSSRDPLQCVVKSTYDMISFEKDILTFYFIIKDTDHIRICMMTEKNNNVEEILRFNVENTDVTFSNKELVINRLKNWNGNIYNFGIYSVALSDDDVTGFYNHLINEYMKYINPNFINMIDQYNETLELLNKYMRCPYDKTVCDACSTITKWHDQSQVVTANLQCRKAINSFCMANMENPLCKCWNTQNPIYNTDSCKFFRGIFDNKNSWLDGLSQDEIDYIMGKYKLIRPEDCPKDITKPAFLKNKYYPYDYNKLKVKMEEDAGNVDSVRKIYPHPPNLNKDSNSTSTPSVDDEYTWDKLRIRYETIDEKRVKGETKVKDPSTKDKLKIGNYYKDDPLMNYDRIVQLNNIEQETLTSKKDTNIVPPNPWERDLSASASTNSKNPFFDRFMKVAFPS